MTIIKKTVQEIGCGTTVKWRGAQRSCVYWWAENEKRSLEKGAQ